MEQVITTIVPIAAHNYAAAMADKTLHERFPENTIFVNDEGKGKKYALLKGIQQAQTEFAWLRDIDTACTDTPPNISILQGIDMLILPLRMTSEKGGLLERLQQTEYAAIQSLTILAAQKHRPIMCSGANLIVRRSKWLESVIDLHFNIPSGDDMFLLESFKKKQLRIGVSCETVVEIQPQPTLHSLWRQRMRWAGKAAFYTDKDIRKCGIAVVLANILAVVCPLFFVAKYAIDVWLIRRARRFNYRIPYLYAYALLLSLVYPWYMLISLIGGILRLAYKPQEW